MRRRPRMNSQRLTIPHIRQIRYQLEIINHLAARFPTPLDTKRQHTPKAPGEILFRQLVALMTLQPRITHPAHILIRLEPGREFKRVARVALTSKRERLDAEEQLLGSERVQSGAEVALYFDARFDDVCYCAEGVVEF